MNRSSRPNGFTLIEVVVVVAIIGILAAIAYPSYTEQIARSRRADAKGALLDAAQWVERQYTVSNSYAKKGDGSTMNDAALPALKASTADYYTLSFATASAASAPSTSAFSLRVEPKGGMANDKCGSFMVTNTGERTISGTSGGASLATCWDK